MKHILYTATPPRHSIWPRFCSIHKQIKQILKHLSVCWIKISRRFFFFFLQTCYFLVGLVVTIFVVASEPRWFLVYISEHAGVRDTVTYFVFLLLVIKIKESHYINSEYNQKYFKTNSFGDEHNEIYVLYKFDNFIFKCHCISVGLLSISRKTAWLGIGTNFTTRKSYILGLSQGVEINS